MKKILTAATTFGLEAVVKREIEALGYEIAKVADGKVTYHGDERAIVRSNLWLACAERVLLNMAEDFEARDFEELYQQVRGIAWEELIPIDGHFIVTASCVKSELHSVPAVQSVSEKAIADRLLDFYNVGELKEDGGKYQIKISILKDRVTVTADTTGEGLHKRGYRVKNVEAPIKETLAAAMVRLSFWKPGRVLVDPCCGSGTIPIEGAMMALGIAPGRNRSFAAEQWDIIDEKVWREEREKASTPVRPGEDIRIVGSDISKKNIKAAKANAQAAGVDQVVEFRKADIRGHILSGNEPFNRRNGIMMTNLPYGIRVGEAKTIESIYDTFHRFYELHSDWSLFALTADKDFEKKAMDKQATRRRKLYNGRIEVCYYQYHGERPGRDIE